MQTLVPREGADGGEGTESKTTEESSKKDVLDLRTTDAAPVEAVFDALEARPRETDLLVVAAAAPVPLYDRLDEREWSYEAVRAEADEWRIRITADGDGRSGERLRRPRRRGHEPR